MREDLAVENVGEIVWNNLESGLAVLPPDPAKRTFAEWDGRSYSRHAGRFPRPRRSGEDDVG